MLTLHHHKNSVVSATSDSSFREGMWIPQIKAITANWDKLCRDTHMLCPASLGNRNKHERSQDIVDRVGLNVRALRRDKHESRTCPRVLETKHRGTHSLRRCLTQAPYTGSYNPKDPLIPTNPVISGFPVCLGSSGT